MKPDAPKEFRGEFQPIKTSVPGIEICEHLPSQARAMNKMALDPQPLPRLARS